MGGTNYGSWVPWSVNLWRHRNLFIVVGSSKILLLIKMRGGTTPLWTAKWLLIIKLSIGEKTNASNWFTDNTINQFRHARSHFLRTFKKEVTQIALPHFLLLLRSKHFSLNLFTQKRNFVILCADLRVVRNYSFKYPNCIKKWVCSSVCQFNNFLKRFWRNIFRR